MTERDHAMAETIARRTSEHVLEAVKSREFADEVVETWADSAHRVIGRAVVRALLYLLGALLLVGAIKVGFFERMVDAFTLRGPK